MYQCVYIIQLLEKKICFVLHVIDNVGWEDLVHGRIIDLSFSFSNYNSPTSVLCIRVYLLNKKKLHKYIFRCGCDWIIRSGFARRLTKPRITPGRCGSAESALKSSRAFSEPKVGPPDFRVDAAKPLIREKNSLEWPS